MSIHDVPMPRILNEEWSCHSERQIANDIWEILDHAQAEAAGVLLAIQEGRISGSYYEGECACLVGTIANLRGLPNCEDGRAWFTSKRMHMDGIGHDLGRPAERFFMLIGKGDTPANSAQSRFAEWAVKTWIEHNTVTA